MTLAVSIARLARARAAVGCARARTITKAEERTAEDAARDVDEGQGVGEKKRMTWGACKEPVPTGGEARVGRSAGRGAHGHRRTHEQDESQAEEKERRDRGGSLGGRRGGAGRGDKDNGRRVPKRKGGGGGADGVGLEGGSGEGEGGGGQEKSKGRARRGRVR
ncbi:hypothetical protein OF83DRAFT_1080242 [Amylostereum chailletii]|nr:hypothetical protein OF83DRAFT_1080242 [Amylostereum chailletii]